MAAVRLVLLEPEAPNNTGGSYRGGLSEQSSAAAAALPIARWAIRQTARKLGRLLQSGETVLWCFHPTAIALQIALRRKNTQSIYHVVDPYENFSDDIPAPGKPM